MTNEFILQPVKVKLNKKWSQSSKW